MKPNPTYEEGILRALFHVLISLLASGLLLVGCKPVVTSMAQPATATAQLPVSTPTELSGNGMVARDLLTATDLMAGFSFAAPVDERAFALPADAGMSVHTFEGRLELLGEKESNSYKLLRGELDSEFLHLPEFDFEFVQSGSYLIPMHRGLIVTSQGSWNIFLEPGRVWQEDGDQGYSRASFPFALSPKGSNAVFNGSMTFLFTAAEVSKVWYQITQETTTYTRMNMWGLLEARYHPAVVAGAEEVRVQFQTELAQRFPTRPIESLAADHPGVDIRALTRGLTPVHLTWYGVVIDGVNYVGGCQTRYGTYAYCESMRAASYSTAKSLFVSVALMRLAQKYNADVADLLVRDYLPETAASPGDWQRVTFNNTLDMATGNYASPGYMTDEDGEKMMNFFTSYLFTDRIQAALDWRHSANPGEHWVYRTCDTFILTSALDHYLESLVRERADLFQWVVDEVYRPLGLGPGAFSTMRTADDGWQGQAEGGYGLWWTPDDIAKLAWFLNNDGGRIAGEQVLHPDLLADALQQDASDRGVDIDRQRKYNNAFWAQKYGRAEGYACDFWVPHMLGVSGNVILLLPNGVTYYYFSDNGEFTWNAALQEIDKFAPFCP